MLQKGIPSEFVSLLCLAAREVATAFCPHGDDVLRRIEDTTGNSRASLIATDGGHKGLCGKHQVNIIAGSRTHDMLARSRAPLAKKYRTQVRQHALGVYVSCLELGKSFQFLLL